MRHCVLFCDVHACDGLDAVPLMMPTVVTIADDDTAAIEAVVAHNASLEPAFTRGLAAVSTRVQRDPKLWFLRGAGADGEEIHAGIGDMTFYRAVPIKDQR